MSAQWNEKTIADMFEEVAAVFSEKEALVSENRRISYREYKEKVMSFAGGLLRLGIKKGDKIAILLPNCPEWLYSMFGTMAIGGIIVPINTRYKSSELLHILTHSESKLLIMVDQFVNIDYLQIFREMCPEMEDYQPGKLETAKLPALKSLVVLGEKRTKSAFQFEEILELGRKANNRRDVERMKSDLHPDDVVNIVYTSGTTGDPKGAMLTQKGILNNGFNCGENQKLTSKDRMLMHIPLFTVFGCVNAAMATTSHGATIILTPHFDPKKSLQAIQKEKVTCMYNVPTMLTMLLNEMEASRYDVSSLRTGLIGGAPLAESILRGTFDKMGIPELTVGYGLTETCAISTQTKIGDSVDIMANTVGSPMPGVEIRCVDPQNRKDVPFGQQGEICIRGFNVMKGYYKNPQETAQVINHEGWFFSGDLGTVQSNGYVTITGRKKDMIIAGGFNIYPAEVEDFLFTFPKVKQVQVVGVSDYKMGEVAMAFIELKEGTKCSQEEIIEFFKGKIANYKIPKYVKFTRSFPMTASGKIQKFKLREIAEKEIIGEKNK